MSRRGRPQDSSGICARVAALGGAGEVLVSRTVVDLVAGSGLGFEDRGAHHLTHGIHEWRVCLP